MQRECEKKLYSKVQNTTSPDRIKDIWGQRTPNSGKWLEREDESDSGDIEQNWEEVGNGTNQSK